MKKTKLTEDDRCAIDLVLEQRAAAGNGVPQQCFGKSTASLQKRVKRVGEIFDLLGQLSAQEPRAGLAAATLKFIQQREMEMPTATPARKPAVVHHAVMHRALQ